MLKGIDVSENQGVIDWKRVKAAGVQFAILRSTKRSGAADGQLANNITGCKKNNIPFAFYKYSYATSVTEAVNEVKRVVTVLADHGVNPEKNITVWMDVEDKIQKALSTAKLTEIVQAFKKEVISAGFGFGLYMGKYDFEKGEVDVSAIGEPEVWLARYYDGYNVKQFTQNPNEKYKPNVVNGHLCGWQWTSSGRVDGISGNVDMNVFYDDKTFNASAPKKSIEEIAKEVIDGKWSTGSERKKLLTNAGYDYVTVQAKVNQLLNPYYGKYTGLSLMVDTVFKKVGVQAKYIGNKTARKPVAVANGIKNYKGTAAQNLSLISLAKKGKLKKV